MWWVPIWECRSRLKFRKEFDHFAYNDNWVVAMFMKTVFRLSLQRPWLSHNRRESLFHSVSVHSQPWGSSHRKWEQAEGPRRSSKTNKKKRRKKNKKKKEKEKERKKVSRHWRRGWSIFSCCRSIAEDKAPHPQALISLCIVSGKYFLPIYDEHIGSREPWVSVAIGAAYRLCVAFAATGVIRLPQIWGIIGAAGRTPYSRAFLSFLFKMKTPPSPPPPLLLPLHTHSNAPSCARVRCALT